MNQNAEELCTITIYLVSFEEHYLLTSVSLGHSMIYEIKVLMSNCVADSYSGVEGAGANLVWQ
jgi:hypothetical protein